METQEPVGLDAREGKMVRELSIGILALPLLSLTLVAQVETARIAGRVTDEAGAVIPGVDIVMTHVGTKRQVTAVTNDEGRYASVPLAIGEYRVEASLSGFQTAVRTGIRLQVQEQAAVDFTLEVGEITDQVEVVGSAPLLNTAEPSQGQVIDARRVQELPLNGRDYIQLSLLSAGAVQPIGGRAGGFSAVGQRTTQNNYLLDGIDNNSVELATAGRQAEMVKPSVDAIQEFKVQTNAYAAEFGRAMGGVVNVTTKSGTNDLHGTLFEFLRNEKLDAKNFFDPADEPKPPFKRNQFGFSVGGPILKDKTFFFGDYEWTRIRESATVTSTIPTAPMRRGDFSELGEPIFDPETFDPATGTRQPFRGNVIPPERIDPLAQQLIDLYPDPRASALANNFTFASPDREDIDRWDIRVDHNFGANDSVYYRLSRQEVTFPATLTLPAPAFGGGGIFDGLTRHWNTGLVWNHVFSSTFLVSTRVGWNFARFARINPEAAGAENLSAQFGIQGVDQSIPGGLSTFSMSGFRSIGGSDFNGVDRNSQNRQLASDATWIRGDHTLKFGASVLWNQNNIVNVRQTNGIFTFDGSFTNDPVTGEGGGAMADFLLGIPSSFTRSTPIDVNLRGSYIGTYMQDDWKATDRLTVNVGARYEIILPWQDTHDRMAQFDMDSDPGSVRLVPAGSEGSGRVRRSLIDTDVDNIAPRIGLTYRLLPRVVVRAGYGWFFEFTEPAGDAEFLIGNPPFALGSTLSTDGIQPAITLNEGAPPDLLTAEGATDLSFSSYETDPERAYTQQWNLNVQYELAPNWLWEIGYFGARGTHLLRRVPGNPALPGPGNINDKRRFESIQIPETDRIVSPLGQVLRHEWSGNSVFHSLQTKLEKRFSQGFTVLTSYILSRSIGDSCGFAGSGNAAGCGVQDANTLSLERALDNQHRKHRFVASYIWELPLGRGRRWGAHWNAVLDGLLGGWNVGGIVTLTSGAPFTLTVSGDPANTGEQNRPDQVGDPERPAGVDKVEQFFNTDAFTRNQPFAFGDVGRNTMIGPAFSNFDLSLTKDFTLAGEARLQFRFEAFNVTNTPQFGIPGNALGNANFGQISSAGRPRNLQFGLKIIF
ncbi:MAG: hypothetical protein GEU99_02435 [Luteitalea sp.]|nr:hypothetical protein [Luteitalea sp.]